MPCPTTLHPQCSQIGAILWMAHSKPSKVWCTPAATTSKALSYSLPQTSHRAMVTSADGWAKPTSTITTVIVVGLEAHHHVGTCLAFARAGTFRASRAT